MRTLIILALALCCGITAGELVAQDRALDAERRLRRVLEVEFREALDRMRAEVDRVRHGSRLGGAGETPQPLLEPSQPDWPVRPWREDRARYDRPVAVPVPPAGTLRGVVL